MNETNLKKNVKELSLDTIQGCCLYSAAVRSYGCEKILEIDALMHNTYLFGI